MTDDTPANVGPKPVAARSTADAPEATPAPADSALREEPTTRPAAADNPAQDGHQRPAETATKNPSAQTSADRDGADKAGEGDKAGGADKADEPDDKGDKDKPAKKKQSFLRELPILLVIALVLAVVIKTFLVQAFFIPSSSMEKTLHGCPGCSGDRVLVNKLTYRFHDPRPGDVVVFRGPESWDPEVHIASPSNFVQRGLRSVGQLVGIAQPNEKDFIKRVIAVGGQTVQCCDPQGRVMVDGRPLDEPYIYTDGEQDLRLAQFGPITVPPGRLWVMGDHRNASADSRVHITDQNLGTISVDDVIGKAFIIVWPPSRWNTLGTPSTFKSLGPVGGIVNGSGPLLLGLGTVVPVGFLRRSRSRRLRARRARRSWRRVRSGPGGRPGGGPRRTRPSGPSRTSADERQS
jgi:signal peptidase I